MQIKSLHLLTRSEIVELARAAADRGESCADANPFYGGHNFWHFQTAYEERLLDLATT